ncbi:Aldo/keto reductase [Exidia glandulosa HHB12029]|uniref:Aldo/keto reductase n=1 Tax=Exidia glandulosa HHB12029 TaxID=1314781 RepID=A0A165Q2X4_EXIGL|nr:Aldo/keto reductase [Exidia glandulosa HHB12029]
MDKESSFKLLDAFYDAGGNFIDTANNYQDETSEQFLGEWMEERGIRDHIVLATKFSIDYKRGDKNLASYAHSAYVGNNAKTLHISLRDSLRKLRTDYIDILYIHFWGFDTTIPELMEHLHNVVVSGKVLYLGVCNAPAWIVAQANQWAVDHGKTPFSVYQGAWNVMERSFERDIIPLAREWGMALCPWNVLAGGKLRTDEEEQRRKETGEKGRDLFGTGAWERTPEEKKMANALEKVAKEVGATISAVAIAYLMQKTIYVVPIIGGRKVEHLLQNIKALEVTLTPEHVAYIESINAFDPGFPNWMIGTGETPSFFFTGAAKVDRLKVVEPLRPVRPAE